MVDRSHLHAVGDGDGPDLSSSVFQVLCTDYPELPRRVVGEVLARVCDTVRTPTEDSLQPDQTEAASRALLDAISVRSAAAACRIRRRTDDGAEAGGPDGEGPRIAGGADLRAALDPTGDTKALGRVQRLAAAIEKRAHARDVPTGLNLVCEAAAEHLGLAAVAISVPKLTGRQFQARWSMYAPETADGDNTAQLMLPMQVGAAHFGVFVLYLDRRGEFWPAEVRDARVFADLALGWLIDGVAGDGAGPDARTPTTFPDDCAEIHQATGMVAVQLDVDLGTALMRLRARARAHDRLLSEMAVAVVERALRFSPGTGDDGVGGCT